MNDFYLVANWKMNLSREEAHRLYAQISSLRQGESDNVHTWVAAPAIHLSTLQEVQKVASPSLARFGAQNVCGAPNGAFTGEISVPMIREYGGSFAIIGHSERRTVFLESEEILRERVEGALNQGLTVVYCVGESLEERESGSTESVLTHQMKTVASLLAANAKDVLIAYEPVWAIGTGKVATSEEISSAHRVVKEFAKGFGVESLPVLYGGSVKPQNIDTIAGLQEVDGALVGGASLDWDSFAALYNSVTKVRFS